MGTDSIEGTSVHHRQGIEQEGLLNQADDEMACSLDMELSAFIP